MVKVCRQRRPGVGLRPRPHAFRHLSEAPWVLVVQCRQVDTKTHCCTRETTGSNTALVLSSLMTLAAWERQRLPDDPSCALHHAHPAGAQRTNFLRRIANRKTRSMSLCTAPCRRSLLPCVHPIYPASSTRPRLQHIFSWGSHRSQCLL